MNIAEKVAAKYWDPGDETSAEKKDPNIPKSVKEKYEEIKEEYPGEPGKAKATAWSIFCEKHKDSPHCHQEEYFKSRKSCIDKTVKWMDFPKFEWPSILFQLNNYGYVYSCRVDAEFGKYQIGDAVMTVFGPLCVNGKIILNNVEEHPFFDRLIPEQIQTLSQYDKMDFMRLDVMEYDDGRDAYVCEECECAGPNGPYQFMTPIQLSSALRHIATEIDNSKNPSRTAILAELHKIAGLVGGEQNEG